MSDLLGTNGRPHRIPWRQRLGGSGSSILFTILLLCVAFVLIYPVASLMVQSFQSSEIGKETVWTLDSWRRAFTEPRLASSLRNTLNLSIVRQSIALVLGVMIAWVIARTNLPGRDWIEFGFWVVLLLPPLPTLLGWILLLDGHSGLVNIFLMKVFNLKKGPFEIFSWWGIVFVHLVTGTLATKVFLLTPAFRNMDAALEDASRTSGAGVFSTLRRIVVPLMLPTILVVMLLGLATSLRAFEVELILGTPANIEVFSTLIYRQTLQQPPQYGVAMALASVVLAVLVPLIFLQQWLSAKYSHATVSGKFSTRLNDLGRWRWPIFGVLVAFLFFIVVLPTALLMTSTFMKLFGHFELPQPWTLNNWKKNFDNPKVMKAFTNTLIVGFGSAAAAVGLFSLLAYISVRTKYAGRKILDFVTWVPATIPGIVMSLGFLWMFLSTPFFRPLYGTVGILIVAVTLATMPTGVQLTKAALIQLRAEMEEASWTVGATHLTTFRKIVMPIIAPALAVVALQVFAAAVSQVGLVALLGTSKNMPLSLLQLNYLDSGDFAPATVTGTLITLLAVTAALAARIIGLKAGVARKH